jgi:hypothetical protein
MTDEAEVPEAALTCPMCKSGDHVRRLLFYTYCANPVHTHKKGEPATNTLLEFRHCIVHGKPDDCLAVATA